MTIHTAPPQHPRTGDVPAAAARGRLGPITAVSLAGGAVTTLVVLTLVVLAGAPEYVITSGALIGAATGWGLLAALSARFTATPQRWAAVPAVAMAAAGAALLALAPDDGALTASGWVWPPALLALTVWMAVRARRSLHSPARAWLVYPAVAVLAVTAVGGGYQTVRVTTDSASHPMPGRSVDVGDHELHLFCTGSGSPTVVLENGLGATSTMWSRVTGQLTTRVCAYDRAGQGWSGSAHGPRDALAVAADLHALLGAADEQGPFVLAGHSAGGIYAMTFAASYPDDVAGMVLLDAPNPYLTAGSAPSRGAAPMSPGPLAVLPTLARMGLAQLVPSSSWSHLPEPAADEYRAFAATARGAANTVEEMSAYPAAFAQAQALTSLGARPLVVVTTAKSKSTEPVRYAAQQRFAALSTNSSLRVMDVSHTGLLDEADGAQFSSRAISDVVHAVRASTAVPLP